MTHEIDFNEFLIQFNASYNTFPESQERQSAWQVISSSSAGTQPQQDSISDYFTLEVPEPKDINHVWVNQCEDPMIEKMFQGSRKDTADSEEICHEQDKLKSRRRRDFNSSQKNETKNIPKNYGKAIIAFIIKHKKLVRSVLEKFKAGTMHAFLEFLSHHNRNITTIADLRALWVDNPYAGVIRTVSCVFLRKHALHYIFNSRVCNYVSHIKYRQRFLEAIKEPESFKHIKEF